MDENNIQVVYEYLDLGGQSAGEITSTLNSLARRGYDMVEMDVRKSVFLMAHVCQPCSEEHFKDVHWHCGREAECAHADTGQAVMRSGGYIG